MTRRVSWASDNSPPLVQPARKGYQRVNELVAEGKTRTEAFAQVGQERGSGPAP